MSTILVLVKPITVIIGTFREVLGGGGRRDSSEMAFNVFPTFLNKNI